MTKSDLTKIPILNPSQFDDYLFSNWKPVVSGFYNKFHIERIENYKNHLKLPLPPHRRSVFFFLFLTKGAAIRSKGLNKYEVLPNNFFCLPADQITALEYLSEDAEGFYCHFLPEIFSHKLLKTDLLNDFPFFQYTSEPLLKASDKEPFLSLLCRLENEYKRNETERFDLIPLYLITLFSELNHLNSHNKSPAKNASMIITQKYKTALTEYIYEWNSVAEYAKNLGVSPNHLHKCVKATTGKTAIELLNEMRVLEAKVLLKQTTFAIGDIAYKIGKFEPSDFSRFFKSKTGQSPNTFRNAEF